MVVEWGLIGERKGNGTGCPNMCVYEGVGVGRGRGRGRGANSMVLCKRNTETY
jgi:hypothetical protein